MVGIHPVELRLRRKNVRAFILADSVNISICRPGEKVKTEAGGTVRKPPYSLPYQRARIIQPKRRFDDGLKDVEAGWLPNSDYLLLGLHTFNGEVDDWFYWLGGKYIIRGIHPNRTESFLASLDYLGPKND